MTTNGANRSFPMLFRSIATIFALVILACPSVTLAASITEQSKATTLAKHSEYLLAIPHWKAALAVDRESNPTAACIDLNGLADAYLFAFNDAAAQMALDHASSIESTLVSVRITQYLKARTLRDEGMVLADRQQTAAAIAMLNKALDIATLSEDYSEMAYIHADIGSFLDSATDAEHQFQLGLTSTALAHNQDAEAYIRVRRGENLCNESEFKDGIEELNQSIKLASLVGDQEIQDQAEFTLSSAQVMSGDTLKALASVKLGIRIASPIGDIQTENNLYQSLGDVLMTLGQTDEAKGAYTKSLALDTRLGAEENIGAVDGDLGNLAFDQANYGAAWIYHQKALAIARSQDDTIDQITDMTAICNDYREAGQNDLAITWGNEAVALAHPHAQYREQESEAWTALGRTYRRMQNFPRALGCYSKALSLDHLVSDGKANDLGTGEDVGNRGEVHWLMHDYLDAKTELEQALAVARTDSDLNGEQYDLYNLGNVSLDTGDAKAATEFYHQALAVASQTRDLRLVGHAYDRLMLAADKLNHPYLAIWDGKRAVNTFQEMRRNVQALGDDQAFVDSKAETYRTLAGLLIRKGRLAEAQQVIQMLKDQEFFEYIHADKSSSVLPAPLGYVQLTSHESAESDLVDGAKDKIASLQMQLSPLTDATNLDAQHEHELDALKSSLTIAHAVYLAQIQRAEDSFGGAITSGDAISATPEADDVSRQLSPGTALIYTIVDPEQIRLIVVTPARNGHAPRLVTAVSSRISSQELYENVVSFREALSHPDLNPQPLGAKFYDLLIKPIKPILDKSGARTLLFSLDDALRYLPMTTLYDSASHRYLVQEYRTEVVTLIPESYTAAAASNPERQILGFGTSQQHTVKDAYFPALPGVVEELKEVVREHGESQGALPGYRMLDPAFTRQNMGDALRSGQYRIVHIASHFEIGTQDTNSYLLLGDGTTMTVADLRSVPKRFAGVDLLTLSACDTGEDIQIKDGHEIDGFGALMQRLGAKSVIASLWPVSDAATPKLMNDMYTYLRDHNHATIAQALQYAQVAFLTGSEKAANDAASRGQRDIGAADNDDQASYPGIPRFSPDPAHPYAHPYYWAPFALIGNWK